MVDIAPFRALRPFTPKAKTDISTRICPPYDVISPEERASIARKNANNIIELELPEGEGAAKYANAAALLKKWKAKGLIQEDRVASFYLLETAYRIDDPFAPKGKQTRYGVLTGLKLETPGEGAVHPHEKTLPKAKEDRLHLLTALDANISPIFGLFFDKKDQWRKWVRKVVSKKPLVQGTEKPGLAHRLWKIEAPALQNELKGLLRAKDLYIADGHHRYEVAWAYRSSRVEKEPSADAASGWRRVMAYICPMEEPGLLMLPTHRLITSSRTSEEWKRHLEQYFDVIPVRGLSDVLRHLKQSDHRVIGWCNQNTSALLQLKKHVSVDRYLQNRPPALRELDVVVLHDMAFGESSDVGFLPERHLVFTRDMKEIKKALKSDAQCQAFLLASPGVESLARVASAHEVMPPKTTYFYPKVPTGFTVMSLEQEIK